MSVILDFPGLRHPAQRRGGRAAVVTGATGSIGGAIAAACVEAGFDVMLQDSGDPAALAHVRAQLQRQRAARIACCAADLTRPDDIRRMLDATGEAFGGVDLLVNTAGPLHVEVVEATGADAWRRMLDRSVTAAFQTIRAALPAMRARGCGRIVNVSSTIGLVGHIACAAHAACEHAVIGLTRCVALETAADAITVNAICPGYMRTALTECQIRAMAVSRGISDEQAAAEFLSAAHPTGRFIGPAEIGALVVFLASKHAASITGATFPVDGGWTAR